MTAQTPTRAASDALAAPLLRPCLFAVALAPALLLTASVIGIASGDLFTSGWAGGVQVLAMAAFGLAFVGLAGVLVAHSPRLAQAVLVLGAVVAAAGAGFGVDLMHAGAFGERLPAPPDFAAGTPLLFLPGLLFPVAIVLAAVALARARLVLPPQAALVALGGVLFPVGRMGDIAAFIVTADVVLLIGLGLVAARLLGGRAASRA